jgi:hypothetical protein
MLCDYLTYLLSSVLEQWQRDINCIEQYSPHEALVEVRSKQIVDELLFTLVFRPSCLVLEDDIVIPSEAHGQQ